MESDLSALTITQLNNKLHSLGLNLSGNKDTLIKRIQAAHIPVDYRKDDYDKLTVVQLKSVLKERDLSVSGLKFELVNRY